MRPFLRRGPALVLTLGLLVAGCGEGTGEVPAEAPPEPAPTTTAPTPLSRAEFVARADAICTEAASRFGELEDPDGVGGAKPLGLGGFMRAWTVELRTLPPPPTVAEDWIAGLDLLDRAADALDRAEAGDPEAQGDALWALEPRAQRHLDATGLPFRACFVE